MRGHGALEHWSWTPDVLKTLSKDRGSLNPGLSRPCPAARCWNTPAAPPLSAFQPTLVAVPSPTSADGPRLTTSFQLQNVRLCLRRDIPCVELGEALGEKWKALEILHFPAMLELFHGQRYLRFL